MARTVPKIIDTPTISSVTGIPAAIRRRLDQVEDYAARKAMPIAEVERWLGPILNYAPSRPVESAASLHPNSARPFKSPGDSSCGFDDFGPYTPNPGFDLLA